MIITRSPLRISLGGGGTDLPSYYREHGGFLIAAAIDKYVYITCTDDSWRVSSQVLQAGGGGHDRGDQAPDHSRSAQARGRAGTQPGNHVHGRYPGGNRARLVGQFHNGAAEGLARLRKNLVHPAELAEQACHIELEKLREPIGKQDQYIAAFGGITCFNFMPDGRSRRGR